MRETVFENGLRVPPELHALFDRILEPYAVAEATDDRGDVSPFLTRREFDCLMLAIDEVHDALNAISADRDDHDRMLTLAWGQLPEWAKSREAFASKWRVGDLNPAHLVSYGFVRGNVEAAIAFVATDEEPAMAVGMT